MVIGMILRPGDLTLIHQTIPQMFSREISTAQIATSSRYACCLDCDGLTLGCLDTPFV